MGNILRTVRFCIGQVNSVPMCTIYVKSTLNMIVIEIIVLAQPVGLSRPDISASVSVY